MSRFKAESSNTMADTAADAEDCAIIEHNQADWVAILAADCDEETFQQVMEQIG